VDNVALKSKIRSSVRISNATSHSYYAILANQMLWIAQLKILTLGLDASTAERRRTAVAPVFRPQVSAARLRCCRMLKNGPIRPRGDFVSSARSTRRRNRAYSRAIVGLDRSRGSGTRERTRRPKRYTSRSNQTTGCLARNLHQAHHRRAGLRLTTADAENEEGSRWRHCFTAAVRTTVPRDHRVAIGRRCWWRADLPGQIEGWAVSRAGGQVSLAAAEDCRACGWEAATRTMVIENPLRPRRMRECIHHLEAPPRPWSIVRRTHRVSPQAAALGGDHGEGGGPRRANVDHLAWKLAGLIGAYQ